MLTPGYWIAFAVVFGFILLAYGLSWLYFRRYRVTLPPVGVLNLGDVAFMVGGIVVVPYLYLILPQWLITGMLLVSLGSVLYLAWEPVLHATWAVWMVTLLLLAADGAAALLAGTRSNFFFAINNLVQVAAAIGITVLWAQSGMKARDAAILGAILAVYDAVFTVGLPLMQDLFRRLAGLPFAPMLAWSLANTGTWLSIGLGDLLLAAAFPLVMRKAYGRQAGLMALVLSSGALALILLSPYLGIYVEIFPLMVVLGPLMVIQFAAWRWKRGPERTTWQYRQAEP